MKIFLFKKSLGALIPVFKGVFDQGYIGSALNSIILWHDFVKEFRGVANNNINTSV